MDSPADLKAKMDYCKERYRDLVKDQGVFRVSSPGYKEIEENIEVWLTRQRYYETQLFEVIHEETRSL